MNQYQSPLIAVFLMALALWTGCAQKGPETADVLTHVEPAVEDPEKNNVLAVVQDLFQAMEARDSMRVKLVLHPEAMLTSVNLMGESPAVRHTEGSAFATSIGQDGPAYIERIYDPIVKHEGDFAGVFARYDFAVGDSLSHCGHDAIQLVKEAGRWKIIGITYTRTSCN